MNKLFKEVIKVEDMDIVLKSKTLIAKGEYFHPVLCTYEVKDRFYITLGKKGKFLKNRDFREGFRKFFTTDNYEAMELDKNTYNALTEACNTYDKVKDFTLVSFSFIYGYCLGKGIDLYEKGVFRK